MTKSLTWIVCLHFHLVLAVLPKAEQHKTFFILVAWLDWFHNERVLISGLQVGGRLFPVGRWAGRLASVSLVYQGSRRRKLMCRIRIVLTSIVQARPSLIRHQSIGYIVALDDLLVYRRSRRVFGFQMLWPTPAQFQRLGAKRWDFKINWYHWRCCSEVGRKDRWARHLEVLWSTLTKAELLEFPTWKC